MTYCDILFKNLFEKDHSYGFINESPHPTNIYVDKGLQMLFIEVACTGISKKDINITKEGNIINIEYDKPPTTMSDNIEYQIKKITQKSFKLSYKISADYDCDKLVAVCENGLLTIEIPKKVNKQLQKIEIKWWK